MQSKTSPGMSFVTGNKTSHIDPASSPVLELSLCDWSQGVPSASLSDESLPQLSTDCTSKPPGP